MSRESEIKQIIEDLKRHLEFQKSMGVARVPVIKEVKEDTPPKPPEREPGRAQETMTAKRTNKEDIIRVEEQVDMFGSASKKKTLEEIKKEIEKAMASKQYEGSTQIVFGEGNPKARLVFVGEAPGRDEDIQGRPFVGRAGQLLNKIIEAMGLKRSDVYISNIVKSRPPDNRTPTPEEMAAWEPYLFQELRTIEPEVVVCLGSTAAQSILKTKMSLGSLRGKFHRYGKLKIMVTYHPAALLRNPAYKKPLWEDMQVVMKELGISRPGD